MERKGKEGKDGKRDGARVGSSLRVASGLALLSEYALPYFCAKRFGGPVCGRDIGAGSGVAVELVRTSTRAS